LDYS
jgi:hypothetical protein